MFTQGVHVLYERMIRPRASDESLRRSEFILNVILAGSVWLALTAFLIAIESSIQLAETYHGAPPILLFGIVSIFATLLWASRKGWFRQASVAMISLYFISITYAVWTWGADLPQGILAYGLIIVMAGVLLGTRASFLVTALSGGAVLLATHVQLTGAVPAQSYWKNVPTDMGDAEVVVATFLIMAVISWLANREIAKSFERAWQFEAQLMAERDSLELKVQERTRELQRLQAEQITQLHPLVEFGRLASGFFHDLTSPLTAISLNLERLTRAPLDPGEARGHAERAFHATKRLEQFLKAVRQQVQQREILTRFSLAEEIVQALHVLDYRSRQEQTTIRFTETHLNLHTFGNPFKFSNVVTNLVTNALDACEHLPAGSPRIIDVELGYESGRAICRVRDTGLGIPSDHVTRIFEPFFTTKTAERGIGIGLSIVKDVIERDFNGAVAAECPATGGACMTVSFPIRTEQPSV